MFYSGIYLPSVGYCLPVCYFTKAELDTIQKRAHRAMLSRLGFNRNTALEVVFGPNSRGAIDMTHLYDTEGFGQTSSLLKSWRAEHSLQSRMIKITVHWAQYTSGIGQAILANPTIKLPHLESHWLQGLRDYLCAVQGRIRLDNPGIPAIQRQYDRHIMDMVLANSKWKPTHIKRINWCRLYLNVTTLSDITNAQGNQIDPAIYTGDLDSIQARCTWQCVYQKKLDNSSWKIWRQFCRSFTTSAPHRRYNLIQPLGDWLVPASQMRRQWLYWHDPILSHLYKKHPQHYTLHLQLTHDFDNEPSGQCSVIPASALPVDVTTYAHTWKVHRHYIQWQLPPQVATPTQIQDLIPHLPPWERAAAPRRSHISSGFSR